MFGENNRVPIARTKGQSCVQHPEEAGYRVHVTARPKHLNHL